MEKPSIDYINGKSAGFKEGYKDGFSDGHDEVFHVREELLEDYHSYAETIRIILPILRAISEVKDGLIQIGDEKIQFQFRDVDEVIRQTEYLTKIEV